MSAKQQRPSVLVTDARERADQRRSPRRPGTSSGAPGRTPMRFMTVDNILQHDSQIPSGQPRGPPMPTQRPHTSGGLPSGNRRITAGGLPNIPSRTGKPIPSRTTKISEKLVLLPVTDERDEEDEEFEGEAAINLSLQDETRRPLRDEELDVLRKRGGIRGKSYAERLPKMQRTDKVSRLTAYCTAQAFKTKETAEFLRKKHEAKTKLYDDCLYAIYALPLMNGIEGYRVRSRPILKTPGTGKTVLDLEIERSEQRDHHEGYFDHDAYTSATEDSSNGQRQPSAFADPSSPPEDSLLSPQGSYPPIDDSIASHMNRLAPDAKNFAEMFVFSYGVVVFWNFTEHQEKDILADLTFADAEDGVNLLSRPLDQGDYETEEFHFEYSPDVQRPRIFNDMITLLPRSDHMIKLTISHAIAQSTKLCFFEERMSETMLDAQHVPKTLALTGELGMTRTEIVKIMGRLFKSRVDINLSSNILDVPNFFWDSEPTLHPLYEAIREYLEIDLRIKVLNERCRVFLDLAEILSDSDADAKMSYITWIIIALIVLSILVTVTEVGLRFAMLEKSKRNDEEGGNNGTKCSGSDVTWSTNGNPAMLSMPVDGTKQAAMASSDLEVLARALGLENQATFEDVRRGIWHLRQGSGSGSRYDGQMEDVD
ncbi:Sporulation protein RMD8 [Trichoderma lentiforme]|uniref:Sporulation protein RMD8 n=1 Tax=Trichoderma lentiforme TaxID=1567552 RepID=A0A9P5C9T8_9HYPO|nr:Sporulation protein RMD8 [Trichoderma lentiforme]